MATLIKVLVGILCAASLVGCQAQDEKGVRTLTVQFTDTAGLYVGNDVGVLGVSIGTVESIEPAGDHVKVTLAISDDDIRIPADASAVIVSRSVATDRYVELTPVYDGGDTIADGATIPADRTETPVDFDEVLGSLRKFADGLTSRKATRTGLRDVVDATAEALKGRGGDLHTAISGLSDAITAVDSQQGDSVRTLKALTQLSTTLAVNDGTVRRFMSDLTAVSELLAGEKESIGSALRSMGKTTRDLAQFVETHRRGIRQYVVDLTDVLRNVNEHRVDLEEVIETLPLSSENLLRSIRKDDRLSVQLDSGETAGINNELNTVCQQLEDLCRGLGVPPNLDDLLQAIQDGEL